MQPGQRRRDGGDPLGRAPGHPAASGIAGGQAQAGPLRPLTFRIFETAVLIEDLERLPPAVRTKVQTKLAEYVYPQLRSQPFFGPNIKKLKDWTPPTWRYRLGPWRLFYEVDERAHIIYLTTLSLRKDAY